MKTFEQQKQEYFEYRYSPEKMDKNKVVRWLKDGFSSAGMEEYDYCSFYDDKKDDVWEIVELTPNQADLRGITSEEEMKTIIVKHVLSTAQYYLMEKEELQQ